LVAIVRSIQATIFSSFYLQNDQDNMDKALKHFYNKCVSFAELTQVADGARSTIQVLRTWSWNHPVYGSFSVSESTLDEFVLNFRNNVRGVDLCVDVNHDPDHRAIWWYREVYRSGDQLFADIEWTDEGAMIVNSKAYRYFSPELYFSFRDEMTGEEMRNVLIGWGITNRPFFKGMKALKMSEEAGIDSRSDSTLYFFNNDMKKQFSEIASELKTLEKISKDQLDSAKLAFEELSQDDQTSNKEEMDAIEAKLQEDNSGGDNGDEGKNDDAENGGQEGQNIQASESINAALFAEVGLNIDQIKDMQRKFSEMERAAKFAETEKKIDTLIFSESNKSGVILPKSKEKMLSFSTKLSDPVLEEFLGLFKSNIFRTFDTKEVGSHESHSFNVPEVPTGYNRAGFILDFYAKDFQTKTEGLKYEEAMKMAHKFIAENGIQ